MSRKIREAPPALSENPTLCLAASLSRTAHNLFVLPVPINMPRELASPSRAFEADGEAVNSVMAKA